MPRQEDPGPAATERVYLASADELAVLLALLRASRLFDLLQGVARGAPPPGATPDVHP